MRGRQFDHLEVFFTPFFATTLQVRNGRLEFINFLQAHLWPTSGWPTTHLAPEKKEEIQAILAISNERTMFGSANRKAEVPCCR
jgi:hypothetical protein